MSGTDNGQSGPPCLRVDTHADFVRQFDALSRNPFVGWTPDGVVSRGHLENPAGWPSSPQAKWDDAGPATQGIGGNALWPD